MDLLSSSLLYQPNSQTNYAIFLFSSVISHRREDTQIIFSAYVYLLALAVSLL